MARLVSLAAVLAAFSLVRVPPVRPAEPVPVPATAKKPVTDTYHGVKVTEDYRWLENSADPAVRRWVWAQNRYTRAALDRLPARKKVRKRLTELYKDLSPHYDHLACQRGRLFALKDDSLVTITKLGEKGLSERVVVDPDKVLPNQDASIDFFVPSPDGRQVAVSLSPRGTEEGTAYVFETATGKPLADKVPRVNTASGGSLAWKGDGSGFFY